jgi:hypothetical protein
VCIRFSGFTTTMPIRFRCAYCNQLMGIARRKAGTVVSCPNCAGQVVVPGDDDAPPPPMVPAPSPSPRATAPEKTENEPALFERGDFDELFRKKAGSPPAPAPPPVHAPAPPASLPMPMKGSAAVPAAPPAPAATAERFNFDLNRPQPQGIVLTPSMATLLSVAIVVALALAFTAGLLVGRFYLQAEPKDETPDAAISRTLDADRIS